MPGWSDGLRCVGFSCLTDAVTWYVCKEASGEPKKSAVAVTWLPYRYAAWGCESDWTMTTMDDDAVKASLKAGW